MSQLEKRCPKCKSQNTVKDGVYQKRDFQRHKCKDCGNRFGKVSLRDISVIPKVRICEFVVAHGFKRLKAIADRTKVSDRTFDKYILQLGLIQRNRYTNEGTIKFFVSVDIKKIKTTMIFMLTFDEMEFINGCDLVYEKGSQDNKIEDFIRNEGFLHKIEMSNSEYTAVLRMDAFANIWNFARSMHTGYYPVPLFC